MGIDTVTHEERAVGEYLAKTHKTYALGIKDESYLGRAHLLPSSQSLTSKPVYDRLESIAGSLLSNNYASTTGHSNIVYQPQPIIADAYQRCKNSCGYTI